MSIITTDTRILFVSVCYAATVRDHYGLRRYLPHIESESETGKRVDKFFLLSPLTGYSLYAIMRYAFSGYREKDYLPFKVLVGDEMLMALKKELNCLEKNLFEPNYEVVVNLAKHFSGRERENLISCGALIGRDKDLQNKLRKKLNKGRC